MTRRSADFSSSNNPDRISDEELASYLRGLARLYQHPCTGNQRLADALLELAKKLHRLRTSNKFVSHIAKPRTEAPNLERLKHLDSKSIERILEDKNRSKSELIDLAWARFSIARGKLLKSNTEGIRQTIRSALLHERSLNTLLQEAHRRGAQRTS